MVEPYDRPLDGMGRTRVRHDDAAPGCLESCTFCMQKLASCTFWTAVLIVVSAVLASLITVLYYAAGGVREAETVWESGSKAANSAFVSVWDVLQNAKFPAPEPERAPAPTLVTVPAPTPAPTPHNSTALGNSSSAL